MDSFEARMRRGADSAVSPEWRERMNAILDKVFPPKEEKPTHLFRKIPIVYVPSVGFSWQF